MPPLREQIGDEYAQFLIAVGDLCTAAERAGFDVEIETRDGARLSGVPSGVRACEDGDEEVDETGYARGFSVDYEPVALDDVIACGVRAPSPSG